MNRRNFILSSVGICFLGLGAVKVFIRDDHGTAIPFYPGQNTALNDVAKFIREESNINNDKIANFISLLNSYEERDIQKNLKNIFKADYVEKNTLQIQGWIFSYNECCFILSLAAQK